MMALDRGAVEVEETFAALVERQARFVYRVAYAVVRNPQDAEDVVQEAFLRICRRGWEGIRDERAFLARTAWRLAINRAGERRHDATGPDLAA